MNKERGFTLIELLVVIAILAVLFGLTALYLNNVGNNAQAVTKQAEKDMVQTAVDVYMAVNNASSITAGGPAYVGPSTSQFGAYLRRTSKYCYTWTATGAVSEGTCP
jgi:prepilin-type N-terminal cleavage/methylation domain-containing protein